MGSKGADRGPISIRAVSDPSDELAILYRILKISGGFSSCRQERRRHEVGEVVPHDARTDGRTLGARPWGRQHGKQPASDA